MIGDNTNIGRKDSPLDPPRGKLEALTKMMIIHNPSGAT
jgi:hypothetical protein